MNGHLQKMVKLRKGKEIARGANEYELEELGDQERWIN